MRRIVVCQSVDWPPPPLPQTNLKPRTIVLACVLGTIGWIAIIAAVCLLAGCTPPHGRDMAGDPCVMPHHMDAHWDGFSYTPASNDCLLGFQYGETQQ